MSSVHSLCDHIVQLVHEAGACAAGFSEAAPLSSAELAVFDHWIASGRHAGMEYMERYGDLRADPRTLLDGTCSILSVAFAYAPAPHRHPLIADYALGEDYHTALRTMLHPVASAMEAAVPGSTTRICIDTAPIRERVWAVRARLGFIGLNNLLIVPGVGSRIFLAEILWTHLPEIPPKPSMPTSCEGCMACVKACPGHALDGNGGLDARRCLSYLTIEHRGELPDGLRLDGRIYGCDICQDVCPHNRTAGSEAVEEFRPSEELMRLDIEAVRNMDADTYRSVFRHSAVRRAKLPQLLRNAARHK